MTITTKPENPSISQNSQTAFSLFLSSLEKLLQHPITIVPQFGQFRAMAQAGGPFVIR